MVKKDDGSGVTVYVGGLYERYETGSSEDFGDGDDDWQTTGGIWAVESGAYSGKDNDNGSEASLWNLAPLNSAGRSPAT